MQAQRTMTLTRYTHILIRFWWCCFGVLNCLNDSCSFPLLSAFLCGMSWFYFTTFIFKIADCVYFLSVSEIVVAVLYVFFFYLFSTVVGLISLFIFSCGDAASAK